MPSHSSLPGAPPVQGGAADFTDATYGIELLGYPGLPGSLQVRVIDIFRTVLDTRLGGPPGVLRHHAAYLKAIGSIHTELSHSDAEAAAAFMVAQRLGQRMAFENIDAPKTACLAVHLIKPKKLPSS
jgi:hypothetical protein